MRSWFISTEHDAMKLELREVPAPEPQAGQIGVRLHAASLNRGEFIAGHGLHSGPARPAGFEAAGEVTALGAGVSNFRLGDRVMGRCDGAFSEFGCMQASEAFMAPPGLDWAQAASAWLVYYTVHDMLIAQGGLQPGEWMLVTGVSSGVGVAALQVAKALGARVIGTSGSQAKLDRLTSLGLDLAIHTRGTDFVEAAMKATADKGVDLAINTVGGSMFAACVDVLGFEGRMATVGYVDGVVTAKIDVLALHKKRLKLFGVSNKLRTAMHRAVANQGFARDILPMLAEGRIVPLVDRTFPFAQLQEAKRYMDSNQHVGKVAITMD